MVFTSRSPEHTGDTRYNYDNDLLKLALDLERVLRNVGLSAGKTFDQSVLDELHRSLTEQYFSRGKYSVRVDTRSEEVPGNKVKVSIDIAEGKRARIRQINITGNRAFTDEELLEPFELSTPNWLLNRMRNITAAATLEMM